MQDQLKAAMTWLGEQSDVIFVGQGLYAGTKMSPTFKDVPQGKRIEWPVAEEMQLGASIGLSLQGYCVVSVFPRWNFLLCATNQLINHLDKLPLLGYKPRVIIRVATGGGVLDPGPQHDGDFTNAFRSMLGTVRVQRIRQQDNAVGAYQYAYHESGSWLIVEE